MYSFIHPDSFSHHNYFYFHPWYCMHPWFPQKFPTVWIHHNVFIHSSLAGYFCCLLGISVVCSSSEYSCIGVLCGHMFASLLGKYVALQWLSHMLCECTFNFLRNSLTLFQSSSTVLHSHRLWRRLLVVHIFKNTCIFRIFFKFNFSLSRMCNDCSLWLTCAFPQWLMVLSTFSHTLLIHLCMFFGEPRQDLCPIITGLLSLLLMKYESSLCRLDTNPLFHIW